MKTLLFFLAILTIPLGALAQDKDAPGGSQLDIDVTVADANARYTIERVVIEGVPETMIGEALRDELQKLTGTRLEHVQALRLTRRLRRAVPGYDVDRKVARGTERGQVVLTFEFHKGEAMRWVHFVPSRSKFVFHDTEGWSGLLDIQMGGRNVRITPRFAFDNGDDLLEEYSGGGLRVEARAIGAEWLGAGFEATRYNLQWQSETLDALATTSLLPGAYDHRTTVSPWLTVALSPHFSVSAGFSVTAVDLRAQNAGELRTSAFSASARFDQRWPRGDASHAVSANLSLRSAREGLGSDAEYTRLAVDGTYRYRWNDDSTFIASAMVGHLTSAAPLFERFTLGDSSTLRGWDKFDVAPIGGSSAYHASVEYRYHGLALFTDLGSVWDSGVHSRLRTASGIGVHVDNFFATFGVPLNADALSGTFMIGVRF